MCHGASAAPRNCCQSARAFAYAKSSPGYPGGKRDRIAHGRGHPHRAAHRNCHATSDDHAGGECTGSHSNRCPANVGIFASAHVLSFTSYRRRHRIAG